MPSQKKFKSLKKSESTHSFSQAQLQQQIRYGPPPLKKAKINENLGHNLPYRPAGLKKHFRTGSNQNTYQQRQSYLDLTLRLGELNFFKRFKNNRYLENFSSKKNMYNICEENTISKLHQQLSNIKRQNKFRYFRKTGNLNN